MLFFAALVEVFDVISTFYKDRVKKLLDWIIVIFKIAVAACLVYLTYIEIVDKNLTDRINAKYGSFGGQEDSFTQTPVLVIGNNYFQESTFGIGYKNNNMQLFTVSSKEHQLLVFGTISDSKGDVVAIITNRDWEILNAESIEYNNDKYGFEIVSGENVIFQIDLKNDTVQIRGLLCSSNGSCFVSNHGLTIPPSTGAQRFIFPNNYDIMPLFKYPRRKYLGERFNPSKDK